MRLIVALLAGGLFGAGLLLSGMTDTRKVQGWLDIFGDWDPTLAFVMGGAMLPMALAWWITRRRVASATGQPFPPAAPRRIDAGLVAGSVLFGVGWGLVGLCPGPVIAALALGEPSVLVFAAAMVAGMVLWPALRGRLDRAIAAE